MTLASMDTWIFPGLLCLALFDVWNFVAAKELDVRHDSAQSKLKVRNRHSKVLETDMKF